LKTLGKEQLLNILASVLDNRAELPIVWGNLQKSMSQPVRGKKNIVASMGWLYVCGWSTPQHTMIFES
jgi:hypothetical protein